MIIMSYILLGIFAGFLGGAFGIGGGIVMVPAILIVFKQPIHIAIGTSLAVIIPIAISGTVRHYTLNNIDFHIAILTGLGGLIGAVLGASYTVNIPAIYIKRTLALILIYSAFKLWFSK